MTTTLTRPILLAMIAAATEQIRGCVDELSALDSAVGDGDHGQTMLRAMEAAQRAGAATDGDLGQVLQAVGWEVMGIDGGATGPLLGSLFLGMAQEAAGQGQLNAARTARMIAGGASHLCSQTPARPGDKTMLDALLPAVEALKQSAESSPDIALGMSRAADAAAGGALATRDMQARLGRARHLGARTLGHADPGATSMAMIFRGFAQALGAAEKPARSSTHA